MGLKSFCKLILFSILGYGLPLQAEVFRVVVKKTNSSRNLVQVAGSQNFNLQPGDVANVGLNCKLVVKKIKGHSLLLDTSECSNQGPLNPGSMISLEMERAENDASIWVNKRGFRAGTLLALNHFTYKGGSTTKSVFGISLQYLDVGYGRRGFFGGGDIDVYSGSNSLVIYPTFGSIWPLSHKSYYSAFGHLQLLTDSSSGSGSSIGLGGGGAFGYYFSRYFALEGLGRLTLVQMKTDFIEIGVVAHATYFFP